MEITVELVEATNIGNDRVEEIKETLTKYGVPHRITSDARNLSGKKLEDMSVLHLPKDANDFAVLDLLLN